jgi:hypothetical protein
MALNLRGRFGKGLRAVMERADHTLLDLSEAKAIEAARQASDAEAKLATVKEALSPSLFGLTSGDSEDARFRRITSPATLRD